MLRPKIVIVFFASVLMLLCCLVVVAQPQVRSVVVEAHPVNHNGPCPATITFTGKIRMSGPGEVQYEWRRRSGVTGPMQTLNFPAPGELEVTDTWQIDAVAFPFEMLWEGLRVLAPQRRDSAGAWFRVQCQRGRLSQGVGQGQGAGQGQGGRPDLTVTIVVPHPEQDNPRVFLVAHNQGQAIAPGTTGSHDPDNGFMIDVVLSSDREVPAEPAIYSPNYSEDVMIRGGRISRTVDLPRLAAKNYSLTIEIPANTPAGNYFLCARIDPFNKVVESIEANNVTCTPFNVRARR